MISELVQQLTLVYDLEVYPNYFLAKFYDIETGEYWEYNLGDDLLRDIIQNPDICLIGFNNQHYDDVLLNFILQHAKDTSGFGGGFRKEVTEYSIYQLSKQIIEAENDSLLTDAIIKNAKYADKAYRSIDLKSLLDPMPSLKKLELRMKHPNVQDLPYDPTQEINKEQQKEVAIYCANDIDATTHLLTEHAISHIKLRQYLAKKFNIPLDKLESASEPRTAEFILSTLATQNTDKTPWQIRNELPTVTNIDIRNCIPPWIEFETNRMNEMLGRLKQTRLAVNPKTGYTIGAPLKQIVVIGSKEYQMGIGGLHSVDQKLCISDSRMYFIADADVTSYYPSILLRDDLSPRGYTSKWIQTYRQIYDERLEAKKSGNKLEADALKIILNATFGKLGSKYSSFYDPELLVRVTLTGQLGLLMLIEKLDMENITVISANTDGIVVYCDRNKEDVFKECCEEWEQQTKLNLEYTHYSRYARRDVNNYTALTTDNKIKNKGAFTPPDIKHDVKAPIIQKVARQVLLYREPIEEAWNHILEECDIYDVLFSFSATKAFEVYLTPHGGDALDLRTNNKLQRTNRWYRSINTNDTMMKFGGKNQTWIKIPDGEQARLMNKVTDTSIPDDLDKQYYLEKIHKLVVDCDGY